MQPESSSTIHPTRTAPLCTACAHYLPPQPKAVPLQRHHLLARCNHPSTPANPATGEALATVEQMRGSDQPCELNDLKAGHCGLEAKLFEPASAAPEIGRQQTAGHALKAGSHLAQTATHLLAQHGGELVGAAGADEGSHQAGICSGVPRAELSVN